MKLLYWISCLIVLSPSLAFAVETTQDDYGAPAVEVKQEADRWILQGRRSRVEIYPADLHMTLSAGGRTWSTVASFKGDLVAESNGKAYALRLADAKRAEVSPYHTGFKSGVKIALRGFAHEGTEIDLSVALFACLEGPQEDLVCELVADESRSQVLECFWPPALTDSSFDTTIVPFMQGMLLPKDWAQRVYLYDTMSYGRGLYMPWWGHQKGNAALLTLIETPDDGGCRFDHPAGGPTRMQMRWVHSLGQLRYPRRVRLCLFDKGNYVDMAKRYRTHVRQTGHFVSLQEKIARTPLLAKLIGSPVVHTGILTHIQPESQYYNKDDPAKNHVLITFDETATHLRRLAEKGVPRAYVHLDGWGFRGYDNLHPDVLPPGPEAGGWDGMRRLAQTCDDLGYVFAIHDQYRDYYLDARSYDPRHTIIERDGSRPMHGIWYGGKQSILCPRLAPGHVRKNYSALLDHGIKVRGAYLDVFAVVPPDECYSPEHPATRTDCLTYRGMCLDFIRSTGGVVSSEEPADWAIPHLDLVHHGPYALTPGPGEGPAMGVPVPLFNLVYHDALLVPWSMTKGGWGIPDNDWGYLHGLANAGLPYISLDPGEAELERVRTMCALHERVGRLEMTRHEFLDESRRKQRTTFADGTTVTIDLEADTFEISPALSSSGPIVRDRDAKYIGARRNYHFDGAISRAVLENYLARAITMSEFLHGQGNVDDNIRMLENIGAKFIGRAIYRWGGEAGLENLLVRAKPIAERMHKIDPNIILQAAAFEIVSEQVNRIPIPASLFEEFGLEPEQRNFRYEAMLYPDGHRVDQWRPGSSVPDMSRLETRMWFTYLCQRYIDIGVEAIHFGQVEIMDDRDPDHVHWRDMMQRVREYARRHARRHMVICDAHVPGGGIVHDGKLMFDLHSFPLRIDEVVEHPQQGVLKVGYLDSLFGRSKGGVTPSGWSCESLPYLVELDNFGRSGREGQNIGAHWIWGYDEICWFAHQSPEYRNQWLRYAWDWICRHDRNGYLQMPGSRTLAAPVGDVHWYWANTPSDAAPTGFGQEETIKAIWTDEP